MTLFLFKIASSALLVFVVCIWVGSVISDDKSASYKVIATIGGGAIVACIGTFILAIFSLIWS